MGRYEPTVQEIFTIRSYCLLHSPYELVDIILDEACHWAHSTVTVKYPACADSWYLADHMYITQTGQTDLLDPKDPSDDTLGIQNAKSCCLSVENCADVDGVREDTMPDDKLKKHGRIVRFDQASGDGFVSEVVDGSYPPPHVTQLKAFSEENNRSYRERFEGCLDWMFAGDIKSNCGERDGVAGQRGIEPMISAEGQCVSEDHIG
ncbi:hypothetical protein M404DRAFT_629584 [Pisolithus tinctorius Marx 270]|uniref:Uncharacterized protein n=1 Tax=Pisolithus tinctorius Marx 270 TaxID=870435 RepID=A0A0C3J1N0_PISTI|nr:hypothetical protein M404DRAFT_629584 [Pisolithus tinctorius Marx 270]